MRKLLSISILLCGLYSSESFAAAQPSSLSLQLNLGDKITKFEIRNSKKLTIRVNGREHQTLRGNIQNAFAKAAAAAKEKSNDLLLCRRQNIQLVLKDKDAKEIKVIGCVGSKTPVAVKLTELANLLALM